MRILVVSNAPLRKDNGLGNSLINIFGNIDDIEIASVYCRYGKTGTNLVKKSFQITEKGLIKNLKNKKIPSGKEIFPNENNDSYTEEPKSVEFVRKNRWSILYLIRNIIWEIGRWKSDELLKFVDDFNPEIIFQPVFNAPHVNKIALFLKKYTDAPMICYNVDDNYSFRQVSFSPLYWIERLWTRKTVKKLIEHCELLYTISKIQKEECEAVFTSPCKILTKCADFTGEPPIKSEYNKPLQLVFTGNIGSNRWKTLALIANVLKEFNREEVKAQLNIYTATPITKNMSKKLEVKDSSFIRGAVPAKEIKRIQEEADILVHVEGFDLKNRCLLHQSFSTKIVDYCKEARPILAVAPHDVASIDELRRNDGAMIVTSKEEIKPKLERLISSKDILDEYSKKAYLCGRTNYDSKKLKNMISNDLRSAYEKGMK